MTGLGEDVYEDRTTALDALTAENERLGIYGAETDASGSEAEDDAAFDMRLRAMRAIQAAFAEANGQSISAMKIARSAFLSIGLPLPDLQWAAENAAMVRALREGTHVAVPRAVAVCHGCDHYRVNDGHYFFCRDLGDSEKSDSWESFGGWKQTNGRPPAECRFMNASKESAR